MANFWKLRQSLGVEQSVLAVLLALTQVGFGVFLVFYFSSHSFYPTEEGESYLLSGDGHESLGLVLAIVAVVGGIAALMGTSLNQIKPLLARCVIGMGALMGLPLSVWLWQMFVFVPSLVPVFLLIIAAYAPFEDRSAGPYDDFVRKPPDKLIL